MPTRRPHCHAARCAGPHSVRPPGTAEPCLESDLTRLLKSVWQLGAGITSCSRRPARPTLRGQLRNGQRMLTHGSSTWVDNPLYWDSKTKRKRGPPGIPGGGQAGEPASRHSLEAPRGTHLNFPVRTCRALIPHRWAPPTSPTMSSPIMTACQAVKCTHK